MRIRVLHVIDHLGYGGAPFVVKNLVERMPADRVESTVCALRSNPRPLPIEAQVITLRSWKYSPAAVGALAGLCAERRIDIVHAHLQKAFLVGLLARPRYTCGLVLHEHGPIFRAGTGCVYRLFLKRFGRRADAFIANSQAAASAVRQAMGEPEVAVTIVPNFIDLERFDPDRYDRGAARASLGLPQDRFAVGFIGRLDRAKGADLLVDAAAMLPRDEQPWCVALMGDGPERRRLEGRIGRRRLQGVVVLAGLQENPAALMRAFDAAVVPSRREAFGIAALEWMRMRVPVIVSPVGGLPELVRDGQTGIVLARLDAEGIAEALRRLAQDEGLRRRLGHAAFERAGLFDGGRAVQQIVEVYEGVMAGRRHGSDVRGQASGT